MTTCATCTSCELGVCKDHESEHWLELVTENTTCPHWHKR